MKEIVIKLINMQRLFFFIIALIFYQSVIGQTDWSKTRNWKLYNFSPNRIGFRLPIDSLLQYKSINLNDVKIISILNKAQLWEEGKTALWKRIILTTYEFNGEKKKVIISNYGGFMYDQTEGRYYLIPSELRDEWNEIFNKAFDELRSR